MEFLRKNDHPSYQFYGDISEYKIRCQNEELIRLEFIKEGKQTIIELDEYLLGLKNIEEESIDIKKIISKEDAELIDEIEFITMDSVRKFQFDYHTEGV